MPEARGLRPARVASLIAATLLLAACGAAATPAPTRAPASQGTAAASPPAGSASAGPASSAKVAVDQGLLKYLPATVASFAVTFSPDATAEVVGDPGLVKNADGVAYGMAVDPATGDLVVAAVVQLKPGVFTDVFYRTWRDTYDKAACAQAGGVGGNAEVQISNRTTYIGTCNGGAHSYHVYLEKSNVLVSATSVGTKRFGEQLMGTLRGGDSETWAAFKAIEAGLPGLGMPVRLLTVENGPLMPPAMIERLWDLVPQLEVLHMGPGRHHFQEDYPAEIAAAIVARA